MSVKVMLLSSVMVTAKPRSPKRSRSRGISVLVLWEPEIFWNYSLTCLQQLPLRPKSGRSSEVVSLRYEDKKNSIKISLAGLRLAIVVRWSLLRGGLWIWKPFMLWNFMESLSCYKKNLYGREKHHWLLTTTFCSSTNNTLTNMLNH